MLFNTSKIVSRLWLWLWSSQRFLKICKDSLTVQKLLIHMNGTVQLKQVNQLVPFCFTWDSSSDWPLCMFFFLFSTIVANLVFPSFPQHTFLRFWYITIWKQGGGKGYRDRDKEEGLFWKLGNFVCSTDAILWEESLSSNSDLWRKWQISGMNFLNSYFWADVMGVQRPL